MHSRHSCTVNASNNAVRAVVAIVGSGQGFYIFRQFLIVAHLQYFYHPD